MEVNNLTNLNPVKPVISAPAPQNVGEKKVNETPVANEAAKEPDKISEEELGEAVDKLNKTAKVFERSLQFRVHDETHRTVVSVVDTANDKVIRQYPSEEVLDMVAKMENYLGMIFDKKA